LQDCKELVHAAAPAGIGLSDVDRIAGKELLEHDAILDVLARRHPNGPHARRDAGVSGDVVVIGRC
jgi:hypothetical protein